MDEFINTDMGAASFASSSDDEESHICFLPRRTPETATRDAMSYTLPPPHTHTLADPRSLYCACKNEQFSAIASSNCTTSLLAATRLLSL